MIKNMLNSFYKFTLIVFRITNANIHLAFWLYDVFFDHFNDIKTQIRANTCSFSLIIIKICKQNFKKFAKYYFKIENKNDLIYNLINILNFTSTNREQFWQLALGTNCIVCNKRSCLLRAVDFATTNYCSSISQLRVVVNISRLIY